VNVRPFTCTPERLFQIRFQCVAELPGCVIAQPREVGDLLASAISLPQ